MAAAGRRKDAPMTRKLSTILACAAALGMAAPAFAVEKKQEPQKAEEKKEEKKGEALKQLENQAGKKTEDVKVPPVSPPAKVP
jgi:hypothetical protein